MTPGCPVVGSVDSPGTDAIVAVSANPFLQLNVDESRSNECLFEVSVSGCLCPATETDGVGKCGEACGDLSTLTSNGVP